MPTVRYRTGNRNPRNVYRVDVDDAGNTQDVHVGCMFDPDDGPLVARALNAWLGLTEEG